MRNFRWRLTSAGEGRHDANSMVQLQLQSRGITDRRVISAMKRIPRHQFVAGKSRVQCYGDHPVAIGFGQTISQPFMVGLMTEALGLTGSERVLEVGTGSGYQTAILAKLSSHFWTIETITTLQDQAKRVLSGQGFDNITFRTGDGSEGWAEEAPFERILVGAASSVVPKPLVDQLADEGVLVIPVGRIDGCQTMTTLRRCGNDIRKTSGIDCRFVPLRTATEIADTIAGGPA